MGSVSRHMTGTPYCTFAETLSGWSLSLAILPKLKDRTQGRILYESCREFHKLSDGIS